MILNEFDKTKKAVINPSDLVQKKDDMPTVAVTCFASDTFERMLQWLGGKKITSRNLANVTINIYQVEHKGEKIAVYMSPVGAPASALILEDVYALGVETVIMFGTCGVLDRNLQDCSVIIPDKAVRDEGTSYHYAPAEDEIQVNIKYRYEFEKLLQENSCAYTVGKTWTTDAFYRETPEKLRKRKKEGCICVDMECSAMAAVAQFRRKNLFQFFYAADNLDDKEWDIRSLNNKEKLLEKDKFAFLAMELAVRIECEGKNEI